MIKLLAKTATFLAFGTPKVHLPIPKSTRGLIKLGKEKVIKTPIPKKFCVGPLEPKQIGVGQEEVGRVRFVNVYLW
jgi:hypothetical protein